MKPLTSFSCLLAIGTMGVKGAVIEKRQIEVAYYFFQNLAWAGKQPLLNAASSTKLKSESYPHATRNRTTWGPFTLAPPNGEHKSSSRQLDKQSEMIEIKMGGLCKECIVLQARAEITDKDGKRMGLNNQVYTHHIIAVDMSRGMNMAPIVPTNFSSMTCAAGKIWESMLGKTPAAKGSKPSSMGHGSMGQGSHPKRSPQFGSGASAPPGEWGVGLPGIFSIFIAKGNEADSSIFAAPNTSGSPLMKSGYWLGKNDTVLGIAEVVNYKAIPQDVYLTVDYNYIPIDGPRPRDYLDVGFGVIMTDECGDLSLHPPRDRPITYNSTVQTVLNDGYIVSLVPHLHDGGLNMKVILNGKAVCESKAIYDQDKATSVNGERWETITSYEPCLGPIKTRYGDKIYISADYDLRKHKLRPSSANSGMEGEAMAIGLLHYATGK